MLEEVCGDWELPDLPVVAGAGHGDATGFREGLTERGLAYAVAVKATTTAPPRRRHARAPCVLRPGPPTGPGLPQSHTTLRALAQAAGQAATRTVTWRQGSKATKHNPNAEMHSQFLALRVRPANRSIRPAARPPTAACPNPGCSSSGHPAVPSQPTTGSRRCPPSPHYASWYESPRSVGELNTTTANSRTASAWTTSRAATTSAGTATSPSPPSPRPSAPCSGSTQKPRRSVVRCPRAVPGRFGSGGVVR
ncbi:transposase [Kitasatospora aureofaciens]|uniref:transposase n=1 Tax=Kitasatospora aureofaciens TaxID=1894 RepID=UPI0036F454D5